MTLLADIERERLRALAAADTVTAGPLHADDYWLVTPNGSEMTKDDYLGAMAAEIPGVRARFRDVRTGRCAGGGPALQGPHQL